MLSHPKTHAALSMCLALTLSACASAVSEQAATPVATGSTARHGASTGLVEQVRPGVFKTTLPSGTDLSDANTVLNQQAAAHCAKTGQMPQITGSDFSAKIGAANVIPVVNMFAKVPTSGGLMFQCV